MKNNYILIDFENVQPKNLELLQGHNFKVLVFVGENQKNIPIQLAETLQKLGEDGSYVRIDGNGKNALDFHIAYYIGKIAETDNEAFFHIISKDTGFNPLITHLKKQKIFALREKDISEIPLLQISNSSSPDERIDAIVKNLANKGSSRPRKTKTLGNTINSLFQKTLEEREITQIIQEMQKRKLITIDKENISYKQPISQP
ncbi:PIN domain-containing protein [Kiritimatiellaeota bacterium B1221]|nr:PIN domain-containing protein [Kiritimatiellaeota bacterium B1221]